MRIACTQRGIGVASGLLTQRATHLSSIDDLADTDPALGSEHRLELLGHTIHIGLRGNQTHGGVGFHTNIQRSETPLAHQTRGPAQRQLRESQAGAHPYPGDRAADRDRCL